MNYSFDLNEAREEDFAAAFMAINSAPDRDGPEGETFRRRVRALAAVPVNSSLKLSMRVHSSPTEPNDEYRIFLRPYIDDRDFTSKKQFSQLVNSYSHSLGDKAPPMPTLTLPIGGR